MDRNEEGGCLRDWQPDCHLRLVGAGTSQTPNAHRAAGSLLIENEL